MAPLSDFCWVSCQGNREDAKHPPKCWFVLRACGAKFVCFQANCIIIKKTVTEAPCQQVVSRRSQGLLSNTLQALTMANYLHEAKDGGKRLCEGRTRKL